MWERELDGEATCNYIQCSIVGGRGGGSNYNLGIRMQFN